jgi:signal transduction histidine kinase
MSSEVHVLRSGIPQSRAQFAVPNDRTRSAGLLKREKGLLEMIAADQPLRVIFEALCRNVEEVFRGAYAIVMVLDSKTNRLRAGAAPSIPAFMAETDGFEVTGPVGTCAAAAFLKKQVITADISSDPYWADYRDLARIHGLRSGWATPIRSNEALVLGTFALYWPTPASPTRRHLEIIDKFVRLVALAMDRRLAADALAASERLARGQTEALTHALDALAKESDANRIMEHVLRTVTTQFDAHSCSVWLRDQISGLMAFEFALEDGIFKTKTEARIAAVSPSLPVEAIPTWAEMFQIQRPIVLEDIRIKPDFPWRGHLLAMGVITMLAVPMVIAGKGEGLIGIRFTRKRTFRDEEKELAQALANQAMLAIQLARLSDRARQLAIASERNRMARDIHDTLAHGFTGVIVHAEAAAEAIARSRWDVVSTHLRGVAEIARDGLREARQSVQALRQERLVGKSLAQALDELMTKLTEGTDLRTKLSVQGSPQELSADAEASILRIGQEVLTNAVRHARATRFDASLVFSEKVFSLEMRDDGCGFDSSLQYASFGLRGMAERADEIGARLEVESTPGAGTHIGVFLPLRPHQVEFVNDANGSNQQEA